LEQARRPDLLPARIQIHQQDAGVVVFPFRSKAKLVYSIDQSRLSRMGGRGKQIPLHIRFPQGAYGVDDQGVRVQI